MKSRGSLFKGQVLPIGLTLYRYSQGNHANNRKGKVYDRRIFKAS
jgi:hypothetical protein